MQLNEYVVNYVCKHVTTDPKFIAYWPECINRAFGNRTGSIEGELTTALFDIAEIRSAIGLTTSLNEHDLMVLSLWRDIAGRSHSFRPPYNNTPAVEATEKILTPMPVCSILRGISVRRQKDTFLELINLHKVQQIVRSSTSKQDGDLDRLAKFVRIALLG